MYRCLCRCLVGSICVAVAVALVCFYYVLKENNAGPLPPYTTADLAKLWYGNDYGGKRFRGSPSSTVERRRGGDNRSAAVPIVVLFTNAKRNEMMKMKLSACLGTLVDHLRGGAADDNPGLRLHLIGDRFSRRVARRIIDKLTTTSRKSSGTRRKGQQSLTAIYHDVEEITKTLEHFVRGMQEHFSYKPGAYYSDPIFFLSLFLHKVLDENRVIVIDIDIQFKASIQELFQEFENFSEDAIVGIAYEQQPVYRHVFQLYRMNNSQPNVGEPPSIGFPGFNSGVLLLHLQRMRNSVTYAKLLNDSAVDALVQKYFFRGHLGDQDFFTLVALAHMELFHILSCGWNRQLCQWWRSHGYEDVFDFFYECNEPIKIYHGNCNTPILI